MADVGGCPVNDLTTRDAPDVRLPLRHIVLAAGALAAAAAVLVAWGPGIFTDPHLLALTHIVTLGWITLTIMGASYQMVPVVLGVRLWSERAAYVAFWHYVPGVVLLVVGFWWFWPPLFVAGGTLVVGGLLTYTLNMVRTLARVHGRSLYRPYFLAATGYLLAVGVYGLTLAVDFLHPFLGQGPVDHIVFHVLLGVGGWVTLLAMGVAYKLTPMFTLSHGRGDGWGRSVFALVAGGLLALIVVLAITPSRLPVALTALVPTAGILLFLADQTLYLRERRRKRLDLGMRFTAVALGYLALTTALGWGALAGGRVPAPVVLILALFGWVGCLMTGQAYKIVPFLVWVHRFGARAGLEPVPLLREMYGAAWGEANLWAFAPAGALMAAGVGWALPAATEAGALCLLIGSLLLIGNLVRVLRTGRTAAAAAD